MGCIFLSLFMMPGLQQANVAWINYALCLSTGLVIPLVLMTEEKYKRSNVDEQASNDVMGHESVSVDKHCLDQSISNKVPYSVID